MTTDTYAGSTVLKATPKALLIRIPQLQTDCWIPREGIHDNSEVFGPPGTENAHGKLVLKGWYSVRLLEKIALEKGGLEKAASAAHKR